MHSATQKYTQRQEILQSGRLWIRENLLIEVILLERVCDTNAIYYIAA